MSNIRTQLKEMYLDYFNNYLTVGHFSDQNYIDIADALKLIEIGRRYHEADVDLHKRMLAIAAKELQR